MYIIRNKIRKAFKTRDGWTRIEKGAIVGLDDVLYFTSREKELNKDTLPKGCDFVFFGTYKELK